MRSGDKHNLAIERVSNPHHTAPYGVHSTLTRAVPPPFQQLMARLSELLVNAITDVHALRSQWLSYRTLLSTRS